MNINGMNFNLPPRSRLYNLEPIGKGDILIEGLVSYVLRLAENHNVTPVTLIGDEILPIIRRNYGLKLEKNKLQKVGHITGVGENASKWVEALNELTGRNDLSCLTLLPWKKIIYYPHSIRHDLHWCPICLQKQGKHQYNPLIWYLNYIEYCPIHQTPLMSVCGNPDCRKPVPVYSSQLQIGRCPNCNFQLSHLGYCTQIECDSLKLWISQKMGELLSNNLTIENITTINQNRRVFKLFNNDGFIYINDPKKLELYFLSSREKLIRNSVEIIRYLKACYSLGVDPYIESDLVIYEKRSQTNRILTNEEITFFWLFSNDLPEFKRIVAENIAGSHSLREVFNRLNIRKNIIYRHHLACFQLVSLMFEEYTKNNTERLRKTLECILQDSGKSPSVKEVAIDLGIPANTLRYKFSDLCKQISVKYIKRIKENRKLKNQKRVNEINQIMNETWRQGIIPENKVLIKIMKKKGIFKDPIVWAEYKRLIEQIYSELSLESSSEGNTKD